MRPRLFYPIYTLGQPTKIVQGSIAAARANGGTRTTHSFTTELAAEEEACWRDYYLWQHTGPKPRPKPLPAAAYYYRPGEEEPYLVWRTSSRT